MTLLLDNDLVIDATGHGGLAALAGHIAADANRPFVSVALFRGGAVARARRQANEDTPILPLLDRYPGLRCCSVAATTFRSPRSVDLRRCVVANGRAVGDQRPEIQSAVFAGACCLTTGEPERLPVGGSSVTAPSRRAVVPVGSSR